MNESFFISHIVLFLALSLIALVIILFSWWYYTKKSRHFQSKKIKELGNEPLSLRNIWILDYLLSSKHDSVKMELVNFLGRTKEKKAVPKILELLNNNSSQEMKDRIIWTLNEIGEPSVIEHMFKFLEDDSNQICVNTQKTIQNIMTESEVVFLIEKLNTDNEDLRKKITEILFRRIDIAYQDVKKVLTDKGKDKNVRIAAIEIIQKMKDKDSYDDLIGLLDNRQIAHYAVRALGVLGDENIVQLFLEKLNDDNKLVAKEAALALVNFKNPEAIKYYNVFGPLYSNKTFNDVKNQILKHGDEIKEPLLLALSCKNERIQKAVSKILGELEEKGIKWLEEELEFNPEERFYNGAILALGEINHPSSVRPLEKILFGNDKELKLKACKSLKNNDDINAKIYSIACEYIFLNEDINKIYPYVDNINIPLTKMLDYESDFDIKRRILDIFQDCGTRKSIPFLEKIWQLEMYKKTQNKDYMLELETVIANLKKKYEVV